MSRYSGCVHLTIIFVAVEHQAGVPSIHAACWDHARLWPWLSFSVDSWPYELSPGRPEPPRIADTQRSPGPSNRGTETTPQQEDLPSFPRSCVARVPLPKAA